VPFVIAGPGPVAVAGCIDGRRGEAARCDVPMGARQHAWSLLVLATAVSQQDQRTGVGGLDGRPEHTGNVADDEEIL
jgi:hypothetical protein